MGCETSGDRPNTVAVTIKEALRRVVGSQSANIELVVDGPFAIQIDEGTVDVSYRAAPDSELSLEVPYEAMVAVGDGRMGAAQFANEHVRVVRGTPEAAREFLSLMGAAFAQ